MFFWPFQGAASFVNPLRLFLFHVCLCYACLVYSLQPCDHLLGKGCPLGFLLCDVFVCFVTFLHEVPGQVRYLIVVSISDLCFLLNFEKYFFTLFFV